MPINTVIRQKRKELGLTQQQLADYLCVSAPAVNKWEKGSGFPDVSLLAALARLLKTDINTLMCFEKELGEKETALVLNNLSQIKDIDAAFEKAFEYVRQYPNDSTLLYNIALVLSGMITLAPVENSSRADYEAKITQLYERVAQGDEEKYANEAKYMLASSLIEKGYLNEAQEYVQQLPPYNSLDRRNLQSKIFLKRGELAQAAQLLEHKIISNLQNNQMTLMALCEIALMENDPKAAQTLADCAQNEARLFGLWKYTEFTAPLELATRQKDVNATIDILKKALSAMVAPCDMSLSPIYSHIKQKEGSQLMGLKFLPSILQQLETDPRYEFLSGNEE